MTLDIYAFDAGFVDGKNFCSLMNQAYGFKRQFPNGLDGVVKAAASMGTRLGHWGGPDGFGNTPAEEQARVDMLEVRVFLNLQVKVRPNWRDSADVLDLIEGQKRF